MTTKSEFLLLYRGFSFSTCSYFDVDLLNEEMVVTKIALKSRFALILHALKSRFHCIYLAVCTTHCYGGNRWTTCQLCSSALHHSSVGWLAAKFCAFRASTLASRPRQLVASDEIFLIGSNRHTAKAEAGSDKSFQVCHLIGSIDKAQVKNSQ